MHIGNAPAAVMGDHAHKKGKWMMSYRFMRMEMNGSQNGTSNLSPQDISGNFANTTGVGPSTLRIVPTEMRMDMHMVGAMYAPSDAVTLMVMGSYVDKEMDHVTFSGGNPDLEIGRFTTRAQGLGDTKVAALFDAYSKGTHSIVAKAGLSLPTGSITQRGNILNPMGVTQNVRLPYAMQLGSGTYDLEPALTYTGSAEHMSWGAQYAGQIRLGDNSQGYAFGDRHRISAWGGYRFSDAVQTSLRLSGEHEGTIEGRDILIAGPVQTADPDNYGGRRVEVGLGLNLSGTQGTLKNHGVGIEVSIPVYQDLNGPQLERDYGVSAAYKFAF